MEQEFENIEPKKESPFAGSPYDSPYTYRNIAPQSQKSKKEKKQPKRCVSLLLVIVLLLGSCGITALSLHLHWNSRFETATASLEKKLKIQQDQLESLLNNMGTSGGNGQTDLGAPGLVYAQNVQAVVAISNQSLTTNFFGQVSETAASGSGFIISEDGYVVSNYHVVAGASTLSVITADGKEYEATLVGMDASNDIAVLKIDATGLPFAKLGSSDKLAVGDMVAAIGNPLGELTSTLTVGYISAKDRMVSTDGSYLNMLQTDAAINSGNSGGPLFNMQGEVVGITTAKMTGNSSSGATIEGLGFAIPIDDVAGMIDDIIKKGYVSGAYLGITARDMNPEVSETYGFPAGVYVESVEKGLAADKAGIQPKDIIVNIGGNDVASMAELTRVLRRFEAGQSTTVTVYRGGAKVELEITLGEKPRDTQQQQIPETQTQFPDDYYFDDFGSWFDGFFPNFGG